MNYKRLFCLACRLRYVLGAAFLATSAGAEKAKQLVTVVEMKK